MPTRATSRSGLPTSRVRQSRRSGRSSIPSQPPPPLDRTVEPEQLGERRVTVRRPAQLPMVLICATVTVIGARAEKVIVDAAIPEYKSVSGISGNLNSQQFVAAFIGHQLQQSGRRRHDVSPCDLIEVNSGHKRTPDFFYSLLFGQTHSRDLRDGIDASRQ